MTKTADMIKSAWPGAQLIYLVEVAPLTTRINQYQSPAMCGAFP